MRRTFTWDLQNRFAELSGDYNPMHMDAVAARRLLFGRPVVHGIHVLLWALDTWLEGQGGPVRLRKLKVAFRSPVFLEDALQLIVKPLGADRVQLDVLAHGAGLLKATLTWQAGSGGGAISSAVPERRACRTRTATDVIAARGELPIHLNPGLAGELFPAILRKMPGEQVGFLLATTRLVGMEVPGEHSVFTGLDLEDTGESSPAGCLSYAVENYDERFSLLTVRLQAPGFCGTLSAALRPAPVEQAGFAELAGRVSKGEFQQERALVVGGSRGLGEVAVKLLAAGGADVKFTYRQGVQEAQRLAADVSGGGGRAVSFAYDVARDAHLLAGILGEWSPTLLCFFATPFAFSSVQGRFSMPLYRQFSEVYIDGFLATFDAVLQTGKSLAHVLYPSSIAVEELPPTMGEYAAAKSAAETLCRFLQKTHRHVRFHTPRLPRLSTDQTASLLAVEAADPGVVVLNLLREVYGGMHQ